MAVKPEVVTFSLKTGLALTRDELVTMGQYEGGYHAEGIRRCAFEWPALATNSSFELAVVGFNQEMFEEDVIHELNKLGLHPAGLAPLLLFGAVYPRVQLQHPVAGYGSTFQTMLSCSFAPILSARKGKRILSVTNLSEPRTAGCRFAAIPAA